MNEIITGSDDCLLPARHQVITWTNAESLYYIFHSWKSAKIVCKMSAILSQPKWMKHPTKEWSKGQTMLPGISFNHSWHLMVHWAQYKSKVNNWAEFQGKDNFPITDKTVVRKSYLENGNFRADSKLAPSQCETSLQSNAVSHWLGAKLESALEFLYWQDITFIFKWHPVYNV